MANLSYTDFEATLYGFIGTVEYTKWSNQFPQFLLTDGANFVANELGAFWLMDMIASHVQNQNNNFYVASLKYRDKQKVWRFELDDGNGNILSHQHIEFSDFPFKEGVRFYVSKTSMGGDDAWVIMLPSEY